MGGGGNIVLGQQSHEGSGLLRQDVCSPLKWNQIAISRGVLQDRILPSYRPVKGQHILCRAIKALT